MTRSEILQKIEGPTNWEVLVIGGGATGLGAALEAATRGYKTILLEQSDFAKSTSSKSTKLVHGGVRYLAQGYIGLVREASIERGILYRNAPHLVKNQTFILPLYTHWEVLKYFLGLKMYDWIAGGFSLGSSIYISKQRVLQNLPNINSKNLVGGILYHDGQFDDARLAINLAQTIYEQGGLAINYLKVEDLLKDHAGKVAGVIARDKESEKLYTIKAKAVINATGVFVDDVLRMDNHAAKRTICVSQGIHLVLDKKFLPAEHALMIPKTTDGRVLFAVPWHNKLLVGTTDTPVQKSSLEPVALEKEIEFILTTAGNYLIHQPGRKDVLSVFAGLRPLAAPTGKKRVTKEISRSHKIIVSASGMFTILGGKWTTYRKMGEDLVNKMESELQWVHTQSRTAVLHLHAYLEKVNETDPLYFYGNDGNEVKQLIKEHPTAWISERLQIHEAQVRWAVRKEMARTVEDVLSRRTRALLLDAAESIRIAPVVARIMAGEMERNENWQNEQVEAYTRLAGQYLLSDHKS